MLTSLDWLVVLFMGLVFASLLSLTLMFLIKNKIVRYVTWGIVSLSAAYTAFFGFMVGITGYFMGQIIVSVVTFVLVIVSVVLGIRGAKHPEQFKWARIASAIALVLGMMSAFII